MVEFQLGTGMPHHHGVGYTRLGRKVKDVLARLQEGDISLVREDLEEVASLAMSAYTVTLEEVRLMLSFSWIKPEQAREVVGLAKRLQEYTCGETCGRQPPEGQECSLFFPRLPSLLTLVSRPPNLPRMQDRQAFLRPILALQCKVQVKLRELQRRGELATTTLSFLLASVDSSQPQDLKDGGLAWGGLQVPASSDLNYTLEECSKIVELGDQEVRRAACWQWCLLFRQYPRVILARRVGEAYMANYSPAILLSLQANHEVELVTSTPYKLFSYIAKGGADASKESMRRVVIELERRGEKVRARELEQLVRKYKLRQVSITEALYGMTPGLPLSKSNVGVSFTNLKHVEEGYEEDNTEDDVNNNWNDDNQDHEDTEEDVPGDEDDYCLR